MVIPRVPELTSVLSRKTAHSPCRGVVGYLQQFLGDRGNSSREGFGKCTHHRMAGRFDGTAPPGLAVHVRVRMNKRRGDGPRRSNLTRPLW